jgi:teichuronic acid biosynthesis glycosyltransferase TuaC
VEHSSIPNRVLMVVPANNASGQGRVSTLMAEQAASLRKKGLEVEFFPLQNRLSLGGIRRSCRQLREKTLDWKPDVVHAQYGTVTSYVASRGRMGVPLVISFCGGDLHGVPIPRLSWRLRGFFGLRLSLWSARHAAEIIVKSRELAERLPLRFRRRAVVLPNGVDMDFFQSLPREECRKALHWPPEAKYVLFNASSSPVHKANKNPELAEAAMERVRGSFPNAELKMFSGVTREEIRWMMNAADCLLSTSYLEGSPNVVKEAMACNLPVVSVPCGDVAERLQGVNPGGVYPYDADALAHGLKTVFEADRPSNGRDCLIAQGLAAVDVADKLMEIYARARSAT